MVMLSCSVILIPVMVTNACVASVCCVSPPTRASDKKLESHSASSPVPSRGISDGGLAGSNVRLANVNGCLSIVAADACPLWPREVCPSEDRPRQLSPPMMSTPRNAQSQIEPREDNPASKFYFPDKTATKPRVYERRMMRKVLSPLNAAEWTTHQRLC